MKILILLLVLCFSFSGCQTDQQKEKLGSQEDSSQYRLLRSWELEKELQEYYLNYEKELSEKYSVDPADIETYMQMLIDKRELEQPFVVIYDSLSSKHEMLTYKAYKKYRQEHPIDSTKNPTFSY